MQNLPQCTSMFACSVFNINLCPPQRIKYVIALNKIPLHTAPPVEPPDGHPDVKMQVDMSPSLSPEK